MEFGPADWHDMMEALLLGAFISEGYVSETRAGFANLDPRLLYDGCWSL